MHKLFPSKDVESLRQSFESQSKRQVKRGVKTTPWTEDEKRLLHGFIDEHSETNYEAMQNFLPSKSL